MTRHPQQMLVSVMHLPTNFSFEFVGRSFMGIIVFGTHGLEGVKRVYIKLLLLLQAFITLSVGNLIHNVIQDKFTNP